MSKKISSGVGDVVYAHFKAPCEAARGNAKDAVDTAVGAYGALAGGIVGGPVGAAVGKLIADGPGAVISFYDTSQVQHSIQIQNCTTLNIIIETCPDSLGLGLGVQVIERG